MLVFAHVVHVDDIHKTISVEVLVSIVVAGFLFATVDLSRLHHHLLTVGFFGFLCLISSARFGSVSFFLLVDDLAIIVIVSVDLIISVHLFLHVVQ